MERKFVIALDSQQGQPTIISRSVHWKTEQQTSLSSSTLLKSYIWVMSLVSCLVWASDPSFSTATSRLTSGNLKGYNAMEETLTLNLDLVFHTNLKSHELLRHHKQEIVLDVYHRKSCPVRILVVG